MTDLTPPALLSDAAVAPPGPSALVPAAAATLLDQAAIDVQLADLAARAARYAENAAGDGTRRTYDSAWRAYTAWCAGIGRAPLSGDPGLVALYLTQRADDGLSVSALQVARAAIRAAHRHASVPLDLDDPRVALVMRGIRRAKGSRAQRQAAAAVPETLRRMVRALPAPNTPPAAASALAARHHAMLLIGFGAGLRRSELTALTVEDVAIVDGKGLTVLVRRAKSDQEGKGVMIAVWANPAEPEFCPARAFEAWLAFRRCAPDWPSPALLQPASAPALFCGVDKGGTLMGRAMADKVVARLLKQAALVAGLDPARFSGHSLRRGLLTDAGHRQMHLVDVMRQSRHKKVETALGYMEDAELWRNNITEGAFQPAGRQ